MPSSAACSSTRPRLWRPAASFIEQDTTTQGNWIGTYGTQGYDVIGNAASLPSYATVTPSGRVDYHLGREHDRPPGPPECQRHRTHRRLLVLVHQLHGQREPDRRPDARPGAVLPRLGQHSRGEKVQISNAATGAVLDTETVSSFHSGVYLDWAVSGNVLITITTWPGPTPCSAACSLTRPHASTARP